MFTYSIEQWLLFFYIYCFLGWCFESGWVSFRTGHLVNRGFMRAPFLPLYGSGAIMMYVVSRPFQDNIVLTYLAGCVGATILEYVTGATMERMFKIKYWDYSNQRFQYKGHICLSSTIAWGFLTIFMTKVIHNPIEHIVLAVPETVVSVIVLLLTVVLTWDFALSFKAALDLRELLVRLEETKEDFEELRARLQDMLEHQRSKLEEVLAGQSDKLEGLLEDLAEVREDIQADLSARLEVRISAIHNRLEDLNLEGLKDAREDYRKWRESFYANRLKYSQALDIRDKFKLHHLFNNPTLSSEQFKEAIAEIYQSIQSRDNKKNK